MKRSIIILLLLCLSSIAFSQNSKLLASLSYDKRINSAIHYTVYDSLKSTIDSFFLTIGSNWQSEYWHQSDFANYYRPYFYLAQKLLSVKPNTYHAYVMSISPEANDEYLLKIAYIKNEAVPSIDYIYFVACSKDNSGKFKLKRPTDILTSDWKRVIVGSLNYVVNPSKDFKISEAKMMDSFNVSMSRYFHLPIQTVKYFSCGYLKDFWRVQGEDNQYMTGYYNAAIGGRAVPEDRIIYSGNNTEYYPHELVHIYLQMCQIGYDTNSYSNISVEGIPTFLGGSNGVGLKYHLKAINNYTRANKLSSIEDLFSVPGGVIYDTINTNVFYAIGGLMASIIDKKLGYKGVIKFANCHSDEECFNFFAKVCKLKDEEVDSFLFKELKKYE